MMKTTKVSNMAFSLLIASSVALTACQRQESGHSPTKVFKQVAAIQTPQLVATQVATPAGIVDNPAVTDLLHRVVRSDLPGMTFNQVKALFPATCIANDDDRSISCPGVAGLVSISYGGGQDGILDMVFSGGMASCKVLKMLVSEKLGRARITLLKIMMVCVMCIGRRLAKKIILIMRISGNKKEMMRWLYRLEQSKALNEINGFWTCEVSWQQKSPMFE